VAQDRHVIELESGCFVQIALAFYLLPFYIFIFVALGLELTALCIGRSDTRHQPFFFLL
jgi:hypothetical protein